MARLEICLLGSFKATLEGIPIAHFETEKSRALLAYLASESAHPHLRESLAEMFWPDRPEGAGRANLRHALRDLQTILAGPHFSSPSASARPYFLAGRETIQLNSAADIRIDADVFTQLAQDPLPGSRSLIDQLEDAGRCYRGPFLDDLNLKDSAQFQEWALLKREQYQYLIIQVLTRLTEIYTGCGDYDRALAHAWHLAGLASWEENVHQQVMRLLALTGQQGAALAHFETCRRILENELGVAPGPQTIQLYEQIRTGKMERPPLAWPVPVSVPSPGFLKEDAPLVTRPVFVARERQIEKINFLLKEMLAGHLCFAFVAGDAGQGKTALLNHFSQSALETDPHVLIARGNCTTLSWAGDPYRPFRDILAMLTWDVEHHWKSGAIPTEGARRLWNAHSLAAQVVAACGCGLVGSILSEEDLINRAAITGPERIEWLGRIRALALECKTHEVENQQSQLFEQYTQVLRSLAGYHPLVLLLDDLQWADTSSINLLFHLGRQLAGSRILIICAYRPEEVSIIHNGERHPLARVLAEFKRTFGDVWVDLNQTEDWEKRRFVDSLLDVEPNRLEEGFRAALFQRAGGHPLFTLELLRSLQERQDLVRDADGCWIESPVLNWTLMPAKVEAVIAERIDRLDPGLLEIVRIASVEGEIFTAQAVAAVGQNNERELLRHLSQVLGREHQLVNEIEEIQVNCRSLNRYKFNHVLFRDYLYSCLSLGEKRLLHDEVAVALETLFEGKLEDLSDQLAYHFFQAAKYRRAFKYFCQAARHAARVLANEEAIMHFNRAIDLASLISPDDLTLANLYYERGLAYEVLGKFGPAIKDQEIVLQMARTTGNKKLEWRAFIELGKLWTSRDYLESYKNFELALKLAGQMNDPSLLASSLNWMGNWYLNDEDPPMAIEYHLKSLSIFEETSNRRDLASTLDMLGIANLLAGDCSASINYYDQSIAIFRELNDRSSLASSLIGRGNVGGAAYCSLTVAVPIRIVDAQQDFEEASHIAREIGLRSEEAWASWSLGFLNIARGEFGRALEAIQNGLRLASEIEHLEWLVGSQSALGLWYVELFNPQEACRQMESALRLAKDLRSKHWIHQAYAILSAAHSLNGDLAQAQSCLEEVIHPDMRMDSLHKRYCWVRRAELALLQSNPGYALEICERLIQSAPGMSPESVITFLWKLKGDALASMGILDEAISLLNAALKNSEGTGERFLEWRIHASLGRLFADTHRKKESQQEFLCASRIIKKLSASIPDKRLKESFLQGAAKVMAGHI